MAQFDQKIRNDVLRALKQRNPDTWKDTLSNPKNTLGIKTMVSFQDTVVSLKKLGYTQVDFDDYAETAVFSTRAPAKPGEPILYARVEVESLGDTFVYISQTGFPPTARRATLRNKLIKLAHAHPEYRRNLLPLLKS